MKKISCFALITAASLLLSGCESIAVPDTTEQTSDTSATTSTTLSTSEPPVDNDIKKIDISSLAPEKGKYSEYDNPIEYYDAEEAKAIVENNTKFGISPDCYFNVPESIDHVSTFKKHFKEEDSLYDFYRTYMEMYKYLFPEAEFDDNNLFYYGKNSNIYGDNTPEDVKTIGKNFSDFLSEDKNDVYYMFYSSHFYDEQPSSFDTHNHFLELSSPVGTVMTNFNKGCLAEIVSSKKENPNDKFLETYNLPYVFSPKDPQTGLHVGFGPITDYDINSYVKHTMFDGKELSVRDAVKVFEDYINTLPYPSEPNLDIKVTRVSAENIFDEKYCYSFGFTVAFEGIPFDYMSGNTFSGNDGYESSVRTGYMTVSNDVDAAYGFTRSVEIAERKDYEEIVPFDAALKSCEENISDYLNWELCSAELVYCAGNGTLAEEPYQYMTYTVTPNYKFKLYNANDDIYYSVFVNAVTGEYVRYYRTRT